MIDWYVAKAKPRSERAAVASLADYGVESYAPRIVTVRRGRQVLEPAFPGYLFVRVDPESVLWRRARWARGVSYFLPSGQAPAPLGGALIDDLRSRVDHWNDTGWETVFAPGDTVHVEKGSLQGLDAVFGRYLPESERCEILISLVGAAHHVRVDTRSLRAQPPGQAAFAYASAL